MAERVKLVAKGNGGKNRMGREKSLFPSCYSSCHSYYFISVMVMTSSKASVSIKAQFICFSIVWKQKA